MSAALAFGTGAKVVVGVADVSLATWKATSPPRREPLSGSKIVPVAASGYRQYSKPILVIESEKRN